MIIRYISKKDKALNEGVFGSYKDKSKGVSNKDNMRKETEKIVQQTFIRDFKPFLEKAMFDCLYEFAGGVEKHTFIMIRKMHTYLHSSTFNLRIAYDEEEYNNSTPENNKCVIPIDTLKMEQAGNVCNLKITIPLKFGAKTLEISQIAAEDASRKTLFTMKHTLTEVFNSHDYGLYDKVKKKMCEWFGNDDMDFQYDINFKIIDDVYEHKYDSRWLPMSHRYDTDKIPYISDLIKKENAIKAVNIAFPSNITPEFFEEGLFAYLDESSQMIYADVINIIAENMTDTDIKRFSTLSKHFKCGLLWVQKINREVKDITPLYDFIIDNCPNRMYNMCIEPNLEDSRFVMTGPAPKVQLISDSVMKEACGMTYSEFMSKPTLWEPDAKGMKDNDPICQEAIIGGILYNLKDRSNIQYNMYMTEEGRKMLKTHVIGKYNDWKNNKGDS